LSLARPAAGAGVHVPELAAARCFRHPHCSAAAAAYHSGLLGLSSPPSIYFP
jgi:hypothetical protein